MKRQGDYFIFFKNIINMYYVFVGFFFIRKYLLFIVYYDNICNYIDVNVIFFKMFG